MDLCKLPSDVTARLALVLLVCLASPLIQCCIRSSDDITSGSHSPEHPVIYGTLKIDQNRHTHLPHFWKSTGFCPPEPHQQAASWLLSDDMRQNLAYIGAMPFHAISNVRIHWLFDTVTVIGFVNNAPSYNFTDLDAVMDLLNINGLWPGFELMGNPSDLFTDMENHTQVVWWKELVQTVATRYVSRYGLDHVSQWNFETWNEPRKNGDFDTLNFTLQGFLNYYDACSEGLLATHPKLKLGAPGGECEKYSPTSYCWALLNHTQNGRNYFTRQHGVRIDYVSIHKKGGEPNNTAVILEKEQDTFNTMVEHFPGLAAAPIYNDEADPLVTWSRERWWRADATYAAMAVKVVSAHLQRYIRRPSPASMNFTLLSNDNGFLSYNPAFFTQRTLLARFQMNNTKPKHVQFIQKPIFTAWGLMSLLGELENPSNFTVEANSGYHLDSDVISAIASEHVPGVDKRDGWRQCVVVYASEDTHNVTFDVYIKFKGLLNPTVHQDAMVAAYRVDNELSNPYDIWGHQGKPKTPSLEQLVELRAAQGPARVLDPVPYNQLDPLMSWRLPLPGILIIMICQKPTWPPGKVTNVRVMNITHGQNLVTWKDDMIVTKCLRTYEVEWSVRADGNFTRINNEDVIFNVFVHVLAKKDLHRNTNSTGFYRVRAVDYSSRPGQYSDVVHAG